MCSRILFLILVCSMGYPFGCKGHKISFPMRVSNYRIKIGETCFTKEGEKGTCELLSKCKEVMDLIDSKGGIYTKGTSDIVRKRICNYVSKKASVCCLSQTQTIPSHQLIPSLDDCGIVSIVKIHNGEYFLRGTHPWLVGVGYMKNKKSIEVSCGGTLITKRHVLTAAHCFHRNLRDRTPQLTHVILGEHSLSANEEREPPIILKISERSNPGYDFSRRYRDIELLVLEKDVEFSNYIMPACLPFKKYETSFNLQNNMTIAGWGKTDFTNIRNSDEPMEAVVPLVPLKQCQNFYEKFSDVHIDKTQICLGLNGKDTCSGDSGGPVIFYDEGKTFRYFVIGITAFGAEECGFKLPAVYTYVPEYLNWIVNNL